MKPRYAILFILFVGVIGGAIYFLGRLYVDNRTLQEKINSTDLQVKQQQRDITSLRALLEALQSDPKAVERVARKHLRMSRGNETIYTFSDPNPKVSGTEPARTSGKPGAARRAP